jgi:hypothetical protein
VLAGGEGIRLRSLTRAIVRDDRPKQYVPLMGADSLLRQTLGRAARLSPTERTAAVSHERHACWLAAEFAADRSPKVLLQPENKDTAAGGPSTGSPHGIPQPLWSCFLPITSCSRGRRSAPTWPRWSPSLSASATRSSSLARGPRNPTPSMDGSSQARPSAPRLRPDLPRGPLLREAET